MPGERRTAASARSDGGRNLLGLPASGRRKDTVRRGQMLYACCGVAAPICPRLFHNGWSKDYCFYPKSLQQVQAVSALKCSICFDYDAYIFKIEMPHVSGFRSAAMPLTYLKLKTPGYGGGRQLTKEPLRRSLPASEALSSFFVQISVGDFPFSPFRRDFSVLSSCPVEGGRITAAASRLFFDEIPDDLDRKSVV